MTPHAQTSQPSSVAEAKKALRLQVLALRAAMSPIEVARLSEVIAERLRALPEIQNAKSIFCYLSSGAEAGTHKLVQEWIGEGRQVYVPAFDKTHRRYQPAVLQDFTELAEGHFGLLEPKAVTLANAPAEVAIVPGLAFDEQGHRLGFGKGYYDAMLKDFAGLKVAPAFDWQTQWTVPAGEHDVPMDLVVTETRLIRRK